MEPSAQDIAAVSAFVDGTAPAQPVAQPVAQPTPQPVAPAPVTPAQQPAPVTPQPAPTQQGDPFASLFAPPTEPVAQQVAPPVPTPNTQPTEPYQPAPAPAPTTPPAQTAPVAPPAAPAPTTQTYEQYLDSVLQGVPQAPAQPDPAQVNPDDPEAIKGFFNELVSTAVKTAEANMARKQAIQNSEKTLWEEAFGKYGSLKTNTNLRDMVHAIRRSEFSKGNAVTPTQAAEKLLTALQAQYQRGVADNQVVTTIESVQPNGGNGTTVPTTMDADKALLAVQTGGETALAQILDAQFKAQGQ